MVICLERGADLLTAQLLPLPLTVLCFSKIQLGLPFLVPDHLGSPGKRSVKRECVFYHPLLLHSRLKTLLLAANSPRRSLPFFFRTDHMDSPDCLLLLLFTF